jgi:DUF1707 SHOCT-like domain/Cell wall-active antibiotics response LiaF, C-terminal
MEGQANDPSRMRISDEDRHKVAEVLRQAAGDGRLDIDELEERLEAAYAAKTYGELVPITVDLPTQGAALSPAHQVRRERSVVPGPSYGSSVSIMGECKRVGSWTVEETHAAFTLMGNVVIDLRQAQFASQEVVINANAVMGEVKVIVDAATTVVVEGTGVMGEYSEQRSKVPFAPLQGGPVVRVRGFALMGAVHVQRKGPPGAVRKKLGWTGH